MKHQAGTFRKLGRTASHRWAMLRTMVTSLIEHERIETTVAKAGAYTGHFSAQCEPFLTHIAP
jgi:ribosomal protein L17